MYGEQFGENAYWCLGVKGWGHENIENDHQQKKHLIFKQILLFGTLRNV